MQQTGAAISVMISPVNGFPRGSTTPTAWRDMVDMKFDASETIRDRNDDLYRCDSQRVFATLVRLLKDFDLADDAVHEAYSAAVEILPREGVPANPGAWLISTRKFKSIHALRRQERLKALRPEIAARVEEVADENAA